MQIKVSNIQILGFDTLKSDALNISVTMFAFIVGAISEAFKRDATGATIACDSVVAIVMGVLGNVVWVATITFAPR